jgi:mannitol-specific phosphotransferase system IIBC component
MAFSAMSNELKRHLIIIVISVLVGMVVGLIFANITIKAERNKQVENICNYSRVANVDTVTELCTKAQRETEQVFLCDTANNCRVQAK